MNRIRTGPIIVRCTSCHLLGLQKFHRIGPCFSHDATIQVKRVNVDTGRVDPRSLRYCLQNILDNVDAAPFSSSEIETLRRERDDLDRKIVPKY